MPNLDRHRVAWTGFPGAPGVSTFYCVAGAAINADLETFFTAVLSVLPTDVNLTIEPSGDTIDSTTGALVGAWTDTAPMVLVGTAAGSYSAVSGMLLRWGSNTYLSGRRLRGHTFLVPIASTAYNTAGQIGASIVAGVGVSMGTLLTALGSNLKIWQRPRLAAPAYTDRSGHTHPAITARGGGYGTVDTGSVRSTVTELRSRRD